MNKESKQKQTSTAAEPVVVSGAHESFVVGSLFALQTNAEQIVSLPNGIQLATEPNDNTELLQALAQVVEVKLLTRDKTAVVFSDDRQVYINIDQCLFAAKAGKDSSTLMSAALACAFGLRCYDAEPIAQSAQDNLLGNAFELFVRAVRGEFEQATSQQMVDIFADFASLSVNALSRQDTVFSYEGTLLPLVASKKMTPRKAARLEAATFATRVRAAAGRIQGPLLMRHLYGQPQSMISDLQLGTLMNRMGMTMVDSDLEILQDDGYGPHIGKTRGEYRMVLEAARRLNTEIPESKIVLNDELRVKPDNSGDIEMHTFTNGRYHIGKMEREIYEHTMNAIFMGRKTIVYEGLPGTGKDEMAREIAATLGQPLVKVNMGPDVSIEDELGGEVISSETEISKAGAIKTLTVTKQHLGEIGEVLGLPCVLVLQEIQGKEHQLVRMNNTWGDDVAGSDNRRFTVNSPSGEVTHYVHPDCVVIVSYNGNKGTVKLPDSVLDRVAHFAFHYPEAEEEIARYQAMTDAVLVDNPDMPASLRVQANKDDLATLVVLLSGLRKSALDDSTDVEQMVGGRQGAMVYEDLMWAGWNIADWEKKDPAQKQLAAQAAATETIKSALSYVLPQARLTQEQRHQTLEDVFVDNIQTELGNIVARAADQRFRP